MSPSSSISKARQNLFTLVDQAANGEKVEFVHKGRVFQIVPVDPPNKLARLKAPMKILPDGMTIDDLEVARKQLRQEVMLAWDRNSPE